MRKEWVLILALALPACAATRSDRGQQSVDDTRLEVDDGFGREGVYLGGLATKGLERFRSLGTGFNSDNSDVGYGIRAGWRANNGWALMGDLRGLDHVNVVAGLLFRF
jgi:hypothetical protein